MTQYPPIQTRDVAACCHGPSRRLHWARSGPLATAAFGRQSDRADNQKKYPSYKIWEDERHLAFLSIFPNTPGFSVVITKEHRPSYVFALDDESMAGLLLAAKKVAL